MLRVGLLTIFLLLANSEDCLDNAIPPQLRKNLTNAKGDSYEVGLWVCEWPAAFLMSAVVHILMEEKIGYNVTETGPGPGSPDAFFALTGCATPTNVTDPGCGDGPTETRNHVSIEGWTIFYQNLWDAIQKDYAATAPVNLGGSGYFGRVSMYLETAAVKTALDAEGVTLDFFRSYNASWHDQSKYFGGISQVNTSLLKPCEETRLVVHEVMQFYADLTGDLQGVETVDGKTYGKCWDGYFWLPPACRNDRNKCILFATGGAGWTIEGAMQKATVWNMPISPIVAKTWADFVALPSQVVCLFYWWEPDPTFLLLNPTEMIFPAHVKREWAVGIQTSAGQQIPIEKYVSYDLQALAPSLVELVQALQIDQTDVEELMVDQLNTQDNASTVACRWLRKHQNVWEEWLPDSTKCFPQFGLYNEISQTFVKDRSDPTGLICRACESGFYSVQIGDEKGTTHVCLPCSPGSAQPSGAATACEPCQRGEYQDALGQAACIRCPQGSYQDLEGQESCKACPNVTSTLGLGSIGLQECRCEGGSINVKLDSQEVQCMACGEGLSCPFGSSLANLRNGSSELGQRYVATIQEGYFSEEDAPVSIFKCTEKTYCPGGLPGTCAGGRTSAPCAECPKGESWSGEACVVCNGVTTAIWWIAPTVLLPSITAGSYYLTNPVVTAKASTKQGAGAAAALSILLLQTVSILGSTTISWPESFRSSSSYFNILMLDMEGLSFSCFSSLNIVGRYIMSIVMFPSVVVWMWLCNALSRALPWPTFRWTKNKTWNSIGSLLQMGYGPISALAFQPLMCYSHPNGLRSLLKQPSILCGERDHGIMVAGGSTLLVIFVIGFLAVCSTAAWKIPAWTARGYAFVNRFSFMTFRFRLDVWWFGAVSLVRMPVLSLAVVLATDNPLAQAAFSGTILAVFLVLLSTFKPWKVPLLNVVDVWCSLCILLLLLAGSQLPITTEGSTVDLGAFAATYSVMLMTCFVLGLGLLVLTLCITLALEFFGADVSCGNYLLNGGYGGRAHKLAEKAKVVAAEIEKLEGTVLFKEFNTMNPYDLHFLDSSLNFLILELFPKCAAVTETDPHRVISKAIRSRESKIVANLSLPDGNGDYSGSNLDDECSAGSGDAGGEMEGNSRKEPDSTMADSAGIAGDVEGQSSRGPFTDFSDETDQPVETREIVREEL